MNDSTDGWVYHFQRIEQGGADHRIRLARLRVRRRRPAQFRRWMRLLMRKRRRLTKLVLVMDYWLRRHGHPGLLCYLTVQAPPPLNRQSRWLEPTALPRSFLSNRGAVR